MPACCPWRPQLRPPSDPPTGGFKAVDGPRVPRTQFGHGRRAIGFAIPARRLGNVQIHGPTAMELGGRQLWRGMSGWSSNAGVSLVVARSVGTFRDQKRPDRPTAPSRSMDRDNAPRRPLARYPERQARQAKSTCPIMGSSVTRALPARAMAFAKAGPDGGVPGSPTPLGASIDGMTATSIAPISEIRNGS